MYLELMRKLVRADISNSSDYAISRLYNHELWMHNLCSAFNIYLDGCITKCNMIT